MDWSAIIASIGGVAGVGGVIVWFVKRIIDGRLRTAEEAARAEIIEQARRGGKVFDAYFEALRRITGIYHHFIGEVPKLELALEKADHSRLESDLEEVSLVLAQVRTGVEKIRSYSEKSALVQTPQLRAKRRAYEAAFAELTDETEAWLSNPSDTSPPSVQVFRELLQVFSGELLKHELELHDAM